MSEPSTLYQRDPDVDIHCGDALEVLRTLPDESVHCVATSPPFYGLRDYGVDGQIGLEETPERWAERLVEVFREARRVLRADGSLWLEVGDGYAANRSYQVRDNKHTEVGNDMGARVPVGYKPKDLLGTPWLLAFALRADGWWLRGCNIWAKPNAMPESAKDRCTTAHSYVFQFAKSARYFFDGDAISEPVGPDAIPRALRTSKYDDREVRDSVPYAAARPRAAKDANGDYTGQRNARSVWTIPTQGFPEAHFATWPEALARRIILAAVPEQVCSVCGVPRTRITAEVAVEPDASQRGTSHYNTKERYGLDNGGNDGLDKLAAKMRAGVGKGTVGFTDCGHNAYRPGVVLDPFGGSGTTALVARKLGRHAVLIDLNEDYCAMAAEKRLPQQSLFA